MGLRDAIFNNVAQLLLERPARKRSLGQWAQQLESSLPAIEQRAAATANAARAGKVLRHVIGIERWGQSRLRVLLGEPLQQDEYDDYQPDRSLSLDAMLDALRTTRAETVELVRSLEQAGVSLDATVPHNDMGPLTARGWLAYLDFHASAEAKKIR